ncbi:MAG: hypothetical protein SNF68_05140 [Rikenellaceae bacterium]
MMNDIVSKFVDYIGSAEVSGCRKEVVVKKCVERYNLTRDRSVYYCDSFAVRFCYTSGASFGNTVLSLSALQKYDHIPFLLVVVRLGRSSIVQLANTTFLKKISHSSKDLTLTNVKGSFNGSDVLRSFCEIENCGVNIESLFAFHREIPWQDNLERLVESTNNISPRAERFECNSVVKEHIINSIKRANDFVSSSYCLELKLDLDRRVESCKDAIVVASHIENVNIRGRLIEYLVTSDEAERLLLDTEVERIATTLPKFDAHNELDDYRRLFGDRQTYTDVKSKVVYLNSNPKAYNIDKFLETMAELDSVFLLYFIGIDQARVCNTMLVSVYDSRLIDATIIQSHWAGRNRRGTAQFVGNKVSDLLKANDFCNEIDLDKSSKFVEKLVNL